MGQGRVPLLILAEKEAKPVPLNDLLLLQELVTPLLSLKVFRLSYVSVLHTTYTLPIAKILSVKNVGAWVSISVKRVGSDTFGDPIFQKGLQN